MKTEVLITYPVTIERLDIYNQFLLPAGISPKRHKPTETTETTDTIKLSYQLHNLMSKYYG